MTAEPDPATGRNFKGWIDMIADNVLRDERRKKLRHRLVEFGVDPTDERAEDPSDQVDYVAYARILLDLIHGLDDPGRAYVRAWLLSGASAKGIASSAEVVRRRLDATEGDYNLSPDEALGVLDALIANGGRRAAARQLGVKESEFYAVCAKVMNRFAERVRRLKGLNDV